MPDHLKTPDEVRKLEERVLMAERKVELFQYDIERAIKGLSEILEEIKSYRWQIK